MRIEFEGDFDYYLELRSGIADGRPLLRCCVTPDVIDLAEECYLRGVLAERLPLEPSPLRAKVSPVWADAPLVRALDLTLTAATAFGEQSCTQRFAAGRWLRTAAAARLALVREGALDEDATVYRALAAVQRQGPPELDMPLLEPPPVAQQDHQEYGVRGLGAGSLDPDRPVLINRRMLADIIERTERTGPSETGGAVLGKMLRLAEPQPYTTTRIVTVLAAALSDDRHAGSQAAFRFSPEALVDAAEIARLRGQNEAVLTAWHSHGWLPQCAKCPKDVCGLPRADFVSADDYQVLESLFSSKATLMPIAGRLPGSQSERPVLVVHHWHGGLVRPLRWREYDD